MVKKSKLLFGLSLLLVLCISFSSLPLSLLHHHDHENDCDIALNIPQKYKKEKDQYPKHYHTHESDCYLCFENHLSNSFEKLTRFTFVLSAISVQYFESNYAIQYTSPVLVKGRAPPHISLS